MTLLELNQFVKSLEARVAEQDKKIGALMQLVDSHTLASKPEVKEQTRKMCPHCGVKPNHFFHVRTCNANKKKTNGEKETPS